MNLRNSLKLLVIASGALGAGSALAQPGPDYGIDFVTVGAVNNPAYHGVFPNNRWPIEGSGSVSYEYRIGRTEITTAQWMQFVNTFNGTEFADRPPFFHWAGPFWWGAANDPTYGGPGFRYVIPASDPNAAMQPVYGISWRECALYCNWLQGGQSSDPASLLTGAYDVSTWGVGSTSGSFTDAPTHLPGARFWIPTLSEQVKAFHYDPNRNGPGQGGYWLNKNMRDVDGIAGPPGVGQTSARWVDPGVNNGELEIPLGAYPDQLSPWGLLDTSGGATEWNEQIGPQIGPPAGRFLYGASAGASSTGDALWNSSSVSASLAGTAYGFRVASSVPTPGVGVTALVFGGILASRRKRSSSCPSTAESGLSLR